MDWYALIPGLLMLGVAGYWGVSYAKARIIQYVLRLLSRVHVEPDFQINAGAKTATVTYMRLGKPQRIIVPYNEVARRQMAKYKVTIVYNGKEVDITQQPGVPYLVSGEMLGASKVRITDLRTDETTSFPLGQIIEV